MRPAWRRKRQVADPPAHSLADMLAGLSPLLSDDIFQFVTFPAGEQPAGALDAAIGWFREAEGMSMIIPCNAAQALGCVNGPPMRHIALQVHSSLEEVGLTAAVAGALAEHDIACNVVAAFHHDHLFVPAERAEEALKLLQELQRSSR